MLRATALTKSFGSLAVTAGVDLALPAGERHGLIGPNGAGKTTLFNLLSGELRPDSGQVLLDGVDVTHAPSDVRARAGLGRSFQRNNLFPDLTVRENLVIGVAIERGVTRVWWRGLHRDRAVVADAERQAAALGLGEELDTPVRHLSYGTQRQLEIGLALVRRPKVLLLDEPTSGMSPEETHAMLALIRGLPSALTLLIIEHDMDVIFEVADRITVLDYGRVLLEGTPEQVRASAEVRDRYLGLDEGLTP
ncbi:MAG: ABC transporter ATP-binding protein [Ectothiorhodospiraceae bacterium]|nr:ABC transporter ATP-binding protein [Chromatiales bacterium]MCP5155476.1 ABC transporter ATP-binding protein [Ectothiorhodospiraceae bacterium]